MKSAAFVIGRAVGLAIAVALGTTTAAAQVAPAAAFDWSVPDRLGPNGMIGVSYPLSDSASNLRVINPELSLEDVPPRGWPANFDGCRSQGQIVRYTWFVDGQPVADSASCRAQITFPREQQYSVALTVTDASGVKATATQTVNIQDWLIIGLGDSYGSGEGVPNQEVTPGKLVTFDAARAAWQAAGQNLQEALDAVNAARAEVDARQAELAAARRDLDGLMTAWNNLLSAQQAVDNAEAAVSAANTALANATASLVAAVARAAYECVQWWDPAGCTAAKNQVTRARAAEAAAYASLSSARSALAAANLARLNALAALPASGFEYARGLIEARIAVVQSRLDVAATALESARAFFAESNEVFEAARNAVYLRAGETFPVWQDSIAVLGSIFTEELPYYAPHSYSQCHQSMKSGQAQAALRLELDDPKTSVTFLHLACTGARTEHLIDTAYGGVVHNRPETMSDRRPQLEMAAALTPGREVDALVTSIGGNDAGFADAMMTCVSNEPCFVPEPPEQLSQLVAQEFCDAQIAKLPGGASLPSDNIATRMCRGWLQWGIDRFAGSTVAQDFAADIETLRASYSRVQSRIGELWPALKQDSGRMFVTPYPLATRDGNGNVCAFEQDPVNNLPGISGAEYAWAEDATATLNGAIADQHGLLGWTVVDGVEEAFRLHGYCSDANWFVRPGDSIATQVDLQGVAHPNENGHTAYAVRIAAALRRAFYPQMNGQNLGDARVDYRQ